MAETVIELPYPPTVNHIYQRNKNGGVSLNKRAADFRKTVQWLIKSAKPDKPIAGRLRMVIEVFPPDKRKRDIANVEKAVNDALQAAQVFHDDEQIDDLRIVRRNPVKQGKVLITIASMSDEVIDKRRAKLQSLLQMLTEEELLTLAEQTGIIGGAKTLDTMRKNLDEIGLVDCEIIESFLLAKFTVLVERIIQNEK